MIAIYSQKSKRQQNRRLYTSLAVVVLLVGGIFTINIFTGSFFEKTALSTGGPVASSYLGFKNMIGLTNAFWHSRVYLTEENKKLSSQVEDLQAKLIRFDSLKKEHDELLSAYHRTPFAESVVLGNVTAKPPLSPYDVLVIDIGSDNGVAQNQHVFGFGGVPIGRVGQVTQRNAKVILFSSVDNKTEAIVERTGSTISLVGVGGGNMKAQVSQEMDITNGDMILLPEFGGLVIGKVVDVDSVVTSAFKDILVQVPVNIFNLRWVEVTVNQSE